MFTRERLAPSTGKPHGHPAQHDHRLPYEARAVSHRAPSHHGTPRGQHTTDAAGTVRVTPARNTFHAAPPAAPAPVTRAAVTSPAAYAPAPAGVAS